MITRLKAEIDNETSIDRCTRKEDQAWEMAGLARIDNDFADAERRTEEARAWHARKQTLQS